MSEANNYPMGERDPDESGIDISDKCERCLDNYDSPHNVPDGEYEYGGDWLCEDCLTAAIELNPWTFEQWVKVGQILEGVNSNES